MILGILARCSKPQPGSLNASGNLASSGFEQKLMSKVWVKIVGSWK